MSSTDVLQDRGRSAMVSYPGVGGNGCGLDRGSLNRSTRRISLFGAFVLAALAATGGGVIRDMLIDRSPPVVIAQPAYLFTVGATILLYFAMDKLSALLNRNRRLRLMQSSLRSRLSRPGEWILVICDGMSLGIFTYVGVIAALRANCTPIADVGPSPGGHDHVRRRDPTGRGSRHARKRADEEFAVRGDLAARRLGDERWLGKRTLGRTWNSLHS